MEVGAPVWVRDKDGDEAWVAGYVLEKTSGTPCTVQIEVDEEFSEEPLTFTFNADDGKPLFADVVVRGLLSLFSQALYVTFTQPLDPNSALQPHGPIPF